jgi:hypothetical protein
LVVTKDSIDDSALSSLLEEEKNSKKSEPKKVSVKRKKPAAKTAPTHILAENEIVQHFRHVSGIVCNLI